LEVVCLQKTEFKVKMCCEKCEEKAKEEAGEVNGMCISQHHFQGSITPGHY
jgi:hypothetical protein